MREDGTNICEIRIANILLGTVNLLTAFFEIILAKVNHSIAFLHWFERCVLGKSCPYLDRNMYEYSYYMLTHTRRYLHLE